jgi:hypothetical protein
VPFLVKKEVPDETRSEVVSSSDLFCVAPAFGAKMVAIASSQRPRVCRQDAPVPALP